MYCYVIYHDIEKKKTLVTKHNDTSLACIFIEKKLDEVIGYEVNDFQVIQGQAFGLKEVVARKLYLTNAG